MINLIQTSSDVSKIIESICQSSTWIVLFITVVFGAVGGITHKITEDKDQISKMGIFANILVGSVAALAVLYILPPSEAFKLIAVSVVASYAGKSLLDLLQSKLEAAVKDAKINNIKSSIDALSNQLKLIPTGTKGINLQIDSITEEYNKNIKSIGDKLEIMKNILK